MRGRGLSQPWQRVKNYMRSTTGQERLNALALMNIESDILKSMDFSNIAERFAVDKSRKRDF